MDCKWTTKKTDVPGAAQAAPLNAADARSQALDEMRRGSFNRGHRTMTVRYHVAPRFTAGSPAMVDQATAERVAEQERQGYEHALTGAYGEADKAAAMARGLAWIAWTTLETRSRLIKTDMLTGATTTHRIGRDGTVSAPLGASQ
jgi:hypothetical protein